LWYTKNTPIDLPDKKIIMDKKMKEDLMPIYEYQCKGCCHCFEEIVFSGHEFEPKCPKCNCGDVQKLISAAAVRPAGIPKGSGGFTPPKCRPSG
jgi:putative FmdB family regulatory protein